MCCCSISKFSFSRIINILLYDTYKAQALIDTGCTNKSFNSRKILSGKILNLKITSLRSIIRMASASLSAQSKGYCTVSLKLGDETYEKVTLHVLDGLCIDIILGTDFQEQQESVRIAYGVSKPPISFAALTTMNTDSPPLFVILTADCKPIAAKSRNNSKADQDFIRSKVKRLAEAEIIKPIHSPWRAQVLLVMRNSSVEWLWTNLRQ